MSSDENDSTDGERLRERIVNCVTDLHSGQDTYSRSISELQSLNKDDVIDVLGTLVRSPDPDLRSNAAEALVHVDLTLAISLIMALLEDADSNVRWNTCGLLHDFGDARATSGLVKVLGRDPKPDIRYIAACALGRVGDRSAIPALRQAQEEDDGEDREGRRVRTVAAEAIEEIMSRCGEE